MANIAVVGDRDSIYGFAALGLDTFFVRDEAEIRQCLNRLSESDCGIIYMTEAAAALVKEEVEKLRSKPLPAVILIPGVYGNTGDGVSMVKKSVEQAVGSDILFS